MAKNHFSLYMLNPSAEMIDLYDALHDRLAKANSLARFALNDDINELISKDFKNYLWALSQLIEEAYEINSRLDGKVGVSR